MRRIGRQRLFLILLGCRTGDFPKGFGKIGAVVKAALHGHLRHLCAFYRKTFPGGRDAGDDDIVVQSHAGDLFKQFGKVTGTDGVFF